MAAAIALSELSATRRMRPAGFLSINPIRTNKPPVLEVEQLFRLSDHASATSPTTSVSLTRTEMAK